MPHSSVKSVAERLKRYPTPRDYKRPIDATVEPSSDYYTFYDCHHPLADSSGRVYLHRHNGSIKAGRWLKPEDIVHHEDENKQNCDLDNLAVIDQTDHVRAHYWPKSPQSPEITHGPSLESIEAALDVILEALG